MQPTEKTNRDAVPSGTWNARQWIVVLLMCAIAVVAYMQRGSLGVIVTPVSKEFSLGIRERFWPLAAFGWGYTLFQIPTGWLTDRWGTRRTLTFSATAWSLMLACLAFSGGLISTCVLWFAFGALQSFVFSGATRGMREWLPDSTWARANGLLTSSMFLGGGITSWLTASLLLGFSWRTIYVFYGLLGVLWAVLFVSWYRNPHPKLNLAHTESTATSDRPREAPTRDGSDLTIIGLLCMPAVWLLLGQQVFRNAPHVFFSSLFPTFLQQHHRLELLDSGMFTSVPLFATLAGCLVSGCVVDLIYRQTGDRSASRRIAAIFGLSLAGLAVLVSLWFSSPLGATLVMSVGAFGSAFGGVASFTIAMDIGRERTGTVFGLMNTAGNLGAAVSPTIMAEIVERTSNWTLVVVLCGGLYLLAAACWLRLRPGVGSHREQDKPEPQPQSATADIPHVLAPLESGDAPI